MTVIINTIPEDERCKRCDGWGIAADKEFMRKYPNAYATMKCHDCFGTGRKVFKFLTKKSGRE